MTSRKIRQNHSNRHFEKYKYPEGPEGEVDFFGPLNTGNEFIYIEQNGGPDQRTN